MEYILVTFLKGLEFLLENDIKIEYSWISIDQVQIVGNRCMKMP